MDLLTLLFRWPVLPLRGLIRLAELMRDQAEQELYDPASVRRRLEEVDEARASGKLSDDKVAELEHEAVGRLIQQPGPGATGGGPTGEGR